MDFSLKYYKTSKIVSFLILITLGLTSLTEILKNYLTINRYDFISIPSVTVIIGFILWAMDKWLYRCSHLWKLFITVPYIGGKYKGKINFIFTNSEGKDITGEKICEMDIYQTVSKIKVNCKFYYDEKDEKLKQSTKSKSTIELLEEKDNIITFNFVYENDGVTTNNEVPKALGFNSLEYDKENKSFEGYYFAERVASKNGTIKVKKV